MIKYLPYVVCMFDAKRLGIKLSINHFKSNDFINILLTLFTPLTLIDCSMLTIEEKREQETIDGLTKRIKSKIAAQMSLECTDVSLDDVEMSRNTVRNETGALNKTIDYDTMKLIKKIKEILPDFNDNFIYEHIEETQTRDIDTLITGLLDKQQTVAQNEPQSISAVDGTINSSIK